VLEFVKLGGGGGGGGKWAELGADGGKNDELRRWELFAGGGAWLNAPK